MLDGGVEWSEIFALERAIFPHSFYSDFPHSPEPTLTRLYPLNAFSKSVPQTHLPWQVSSRTSSFCIFLVRSTRKSMGSFPVSPTVSPEKFENLPDRVFFQVPMAPSGKTWNPHIVFIRIFHIAQNRCLPGCTL